MKTDKKPKDFRYNIRALSITIPVIILCIITIAIYIQNETDQLQSSISNKTEYQATLFANIANNILDNTDLVLRHVVSLLEIPENFQDGLSSSLERQIRNELLMAQELNYLSIITTDGRSIWKSPGAPNTSADCYKTAVEAHIKKGLKFNITEILPDRNTSGKIVLSRTAVQNGKIKLIVIAAIDNASIIPFDYEQYFDNSTSLSILNSDLKPLAHKGVFSYEKILELGNSEKQIL